MTKVAVVAHGRKRLGGGPEALREALRIRGVEEPLWFEVSKSKKAPKRAREAVRRGAQLVVVWGGDGTVQRCVDELAGTGVAIAVVPAGTANLLATHLGIPRDLDGAVDLALSGRRRALDTGVVNGERFLVMAGTGFDARLIAAADRELKRRFGRLAYVWAALKATRTTAVPTEVTVDGRRWHDGPAACALVANVAAIGPLQLFPGSADDDGLLEVGVVSRGGRLAWARVLLGVLAGRPQRSPLVHSTQGRHVVIEPAQPLPYELDGGDRDRTRRLDVRLDPLSALVVVPAEEAPCPP